MSTASERVQAAMPPLLATYGPIGSAESACVDATFTIRPPGIIDRPHRHVSSSINYYFTGSGYSVVAGQRYEWSAGDLQVSAPGWAVHNHASNDGDPVHELTIQDQPLTIYMESLLWQESMKGPKVILGTHEGFQTNREK